MKPLILITLIALLAGCSTSPTLTAVTERAAAIDARTNDDLLDTAEFINCEGASIGSIRRKFGDPERSQVWQALCNPADNFRP